jgi:hypothetical protein
LMMPMGTETSYVPVLQSLNLWKPEQC